MLELRMLFSNFKLARALMLLLIVGFGLLIATPVYAEEVKADPKISILIPLIAIGLYSLLCALVQQNWLKDGTLYEQKLSKKIRFLLGIVLVLGLGLRFYLAATNSGYVNDLSLFHYWGNYAYDNGLFQLYHGELFIDYPPGYMFVLYFLAWLQDAFHIQYGTSAFLVLYKLPAIIADLLAAIFLYRQAIKKCSLPVSIAIMLVYWFNPVVLLDGAVWGQVDSIFALALIVSITYFTNKKIAAGSIAFAITALIKPQAFIFMPIVLLALWYKKSWKSVGISALYGFGAFLLIALPLFLSGGGVRQLVELYAGTLSSYAYGSVNAYNIYSLFGYNWISIDEKLLGIKLTAWGYVGIVLAVLYAAWIGLCGKLKQAQLYFIAASLIGIVFVLVTKMHERYMFVILLLLLMAFIEQRDRRLLHLFYGFSITNMLNLYVVLAFSAETTFIPNDGVAILCAAGNVVLVAYMIYVGFDLYIRGNNKLIHSRSEQKIVEDNARGLITELMDKDQLQPAKRWFDIDMGKKDWLIIAAGMLVYSVVAFTNLGDMKAPHTVWTPTEVGESIVIDLSEVKAIGRITTFGGVGHGEYSYAFANEIGSWSNELVVTANHVSVFAWHEEEANVEARYIKLTATKIGFRIHELGVYEQVTEQQLLVTLSNDATYSQEGAALIDEQQLAQYHHNYKHGSYFDEVYHARTAYEHIEGIVAYESTHPPLGKILIALGIKLFGFGPFGWRVMGTLFGVLMLPLIYMMTKAILRKTTIAAASMILLAVDFMHFAQTRIATIDVYAVFFIMLMFFFMNQYMSLNFYREKLRHTWIPLGLAGLSFGLGVASKWIVLYGGAGLACILVIVLWRRYGEYRAAKGLLAKGATKLKDSYVKQLQHIQSTFLPYTVGTLLICLAFFLIIPIGIYALSYLPVLKPMSTGYTLKALIDYQINMYNYHSNLVSSHPFSSTWWEWPFMKRPVWYFVDNGLAPGLRSTIATLGNPLIWWTGIFAMIATVFISIRKKHYMMIGIFIAYGAQYVPWMLVPRETFIYHYFSMVPFLIISLVYIWHCLEEKRTNWKFGRYMYIALAIGLFVMFYPALSGAIVPASYIENYLRWFPSWLF